MKTLCKIAELLKIWFLSGGKYRISVVQARFEDWIGLLGLVMMTLGQYIPEFVAMGESVCQCVWMNGWDLIRNEWLKLIDWMNGDKCIWNVC